MREIKFRAWDKLNREMTYFSLFERPTTCYGKEYEIMQYTGLKDKNGKEIYEGDIIRFKRSGYVSGNWQSIGVVEWDKYHTKFHYSMKKEEDGECWSDWNLFPDTDYEIIGNIYENPDLLK